MRLCTPLVSSPPPSQKWCCALLGTDVCCVGLQCKYCQLLPLVPAHVTTSIPPLLKMCSKQPLARHNGHAGELARSQQCKFARLGRTSYTGWIRNLSLAGSDLQSSDRVILQLDAWFQLVQAYQDTVSQPQFCLLCLALAPSSHKEAWRRDSGVSWVSVQNTSLALVTLNSSARPVRGCCSFLVWP